MTYRAAWFTASGQPSPGLDLGTVQPGATATIERRLRNIGDQPFSGVAFLLPQGLPGLTVTVGGVPLVPGTPYTTPAVPPEGEVAVSYTRTVPALADPGTFAAFLSIRALT